MKKAKNLLKIQKLLEEEKYQSDVALVYQFFIAGKNKIKAKTNKNYMRHQKK